MSASSWWCTAPPAGSSRRTIRSGTSRASQQAVEEADDRFGAALAAGDFDDDGCDDLAIGSPDEDIGAETDAGGVQIVYGSSLGLVTDGNVFFRQGADGVSGAPEAADRFGASLAIGDFDDDAFDDLAIGVAGESIERCRPGRGRAHPVRLPGRADRLQ